MVPAMRESTSSAPSQGGAELEEEEEEALSVPFTNVNRIFKLLKEYEPYKDFLICRGLKKACFIILLVKN